MAVTTTVNCSVHNTTDDVVLFTAPVRLVGQGLEIETFGFRSWRSYNQQSWEDIHFKLGLFNQLENRHWGLNQQTITQNSTVLQLSCFLFR